MAFHFITLSFLALFSPTLAINWGRCPSVPTVDDFDVTKYYGKWYEIARSDNIPFENGARCVTAEYTPTWSRRISVQNTGIVDGDDGPEVREAQGEAWIPDEDYPAQLRVKLSPCKYTVFG
ncbi:Apolipoprotein D [Holothuria leucospilota]|uniref:Apolipoprotein D n=1 Tax=Holothuria leucospilota TaxID=206669 RepID=A0A9Q1CAZ3_HOLLE|nr:Apolipoprotein D [Holothuria leucospilota]